MAGREPEKMQEAKLPICFSLPYPTLPPDSNAVASTSGHRLHGADDLISLFGLRSLWERSVKPYATSSRAVKQHQRVDSSHIGGPDVGEMSAAAHGDVGAKVLEKSYAEYVQDLPGKVRPAKRTISKFQNALNAALSAGEPQPAIPPEITGRTTMRDIVFRPETTVQRVGPFEPDVLRAAFTVEAGDVPQLDLSLLESDEVERQSPTKRKKKRKHQREATDRSNVSDGAAAKRARLSNLVNQRPAN